MAKKVKGREIYFEVGYDRKWCRYQGGREEIDDEPNVQEV